VDFILQQFEEGLGRPRHTLDPAAILDFIGDTRLGRALLATLSQWYRMRPRTFAEVLQSRAGGPAAQARLLAQEIAGPTDLRAWVYGAVNRDGHGYLDPETEAHFWAGRSRAVGVRREALGQMMLLDRPEEAILVRTGPAPSAADVMAAYNARAHTTLLRCAREVSLRCGARGSLLERAARTWALGLDVEWRVEGDTLILLGSADALGRWTRHGRRVERAALELLSLPDLEVSEVRGRLEVGDRNCGFHWKGETLSRLSGGGVPLQEELPEEIPAFAAMLRRERERAGDPSWGIRRASHVIGVEAAVRLPHLELRRGDLSLHLRLTGPHPDEMDPETVAPFEGKTPLALAGWSGGQEEPVTLLFPGGEPEQHSVGKVLSVLAERLEGWQEATREPLKRAA
jgi:hypothetical protein